MTSADVLPLDRHRPEEPRPKRGLLLAGGVIGIALGGFFDGILLHQILQWHHFLSLVPGEALRDLKNQIIADGAFHVLMYVIAAVGLLMLWRARAGLNGAGAGRCLLGSVLLGFGIWQVIDVVVFHWIIGIHRIRVDVPEPLPWDIGWMIVFGAPALVAGWLILRRAGGSSTPGQGRRMAAGLAALVLVAGPVAARPPADAAAVMVLFRAGTGSAQALNAVAAIDGRVIWADPSGELVAFAPAPGRSALGLYRYGALAVGATPIVAGCLAWIKT
ncbi:MAG TPA: DUF2243 domain-containing protein [Beijerinckiaceae bacterium]|jgi:uncharacterized membrane protein